MRKRTCLAAAACGVGAACIFGFTSEHWTVKERETVTKILVLTGAPNRVVIDNLEGYVHATASADSKIHVVAQKTIRAETDADFAEAKREVKLDFTEKEGQVSVYYDAPWRCRGNRQPCSGESRRVYAVTYDIDVAVPADATVVLSTVNGGDVQADGLGGNFEAGNVNGAIRMNAMRASGDAHTVNGAIAIHFARSPSRSCRFKTVNGSLDVFSPSDLSADLSFETLNGAVYTDFDVSPRTMPVQSERRDGKFVYRGKRTMAARVGRGGPELDFKTLNGSIRLHREN
jgi:hypothetical protein